MAKHSLSDRTSPKSYEGLPPKPDGESQHRRYSLGMKYAPKVAGILAGSAFLPFLGIEVWNEGVGLWNELLLWAVGIGQLENGFIVGQTMLMALCLHSRVHYGCRTRIWALGRVLD